MWKEDRLDHESGPMGAVPIGKDERHWGGSQWQEQARTNYHRLVWNRLLYKR